MKIIDISWPISENMTTYKNKKVVEFKPAKEFEKDNARETILTLNTHVGTHIDAPSHFLKDGKTIDQIALEKLCGPCRVLDLTNVQESISEKDLEKFDILENEIILLKTKNSSKSPSEEFDPLFIYLKADGAKYLANKKIKAVGIDYLGIERNQPGHPTHKALLEAQIPIIEGLRLEQVSKDTYNLICLPISLDGLDAAPARAILI